jgi:hypothetical protein
MAENHIDDIGSSLMETVSSNGLSEILEDIGEITLDSFLEDGVIKDLPVIGTVVRLGKTLHSIRDFFFVKKVWAFLKGVNEIPYKQRKAFVDKLKKDEKYEHRAGETITMLLDRYDNLQKPSFMAKLLGAYAQGEIDFSEFLRLSTAIDRAFIDDLNDLLNYFSGKDIETERVKRSLYTSNLSDFFVMSEETFKKSGLEFPQVYAFNRLAERFARIILGPKFQEGRL